MRIKIFFIGNSSAVKFFLVIRLRNGVILVEIMSSRFSLYTVSNVGNS